MKYECDINVTFEVLRSVGMCLCDQKLFLIEVKVNSTAWIQKVRIPMFCEKRAQVIWEYAN